MFKKVLTMAAIASLAFGVVACQKQASTDDNGQPMDQTAADNKAAADNMNADTSSEANKNTAATDSTQPNSTDTTTTTTTPDANQAQTH